MNKIITLAIAAFLLTGIAACKKDSKTLNCRLAGRASYADSMAITYDAQGRVSAFNYGAGYAYTLTYGGLTAQAVVSTTTDPTVQTYNIFLNSNGQASSINTSTTISGTTYDYSYVFFYDTEGHIIRCEQEQDNLSNTNDSYKYDSMVYENGNLTKQYSYAANASSGPWFLQEYFTTTYTEKPNTLGYHAFSNFEEPTSILSGYYPFFHLYGKASAKLPLETTFYDNGGALSFRMSYAYLFDENGYVTEENVSRSVIFPSTENRRYYYTCE